jgi:hypothetical protein
MLDAPLRASAPLGAAFAAHGVRTWAGAVRFVHALPYGRNADRADAGLVLGEQHGTCSTKHALLAALGAETDLPVRLLLGLTLLRAETHPRAAATLAAAGLAEIPEAHCVLDVAGRRLDVTFPGSTGAPPPMEHVHEIAPHQIGPYKLDWHRQALDGWSQERGFDGTHVWRTREACIAALGDAGPAPPTCAGS